MSAMAAMNPAIVYPAQGMLVLLGRAWNLCRNTWRDGLILMLPPMLLTTVFSILVSIPASQTFLLPASLLELAVKLVIGVLIVLTGLLTFLVWVYSSGSLLRFYDSAIVCDRPLPSPECRRFIVRRKGSWLAMAGLSLAGLVGFILTDLAVVFVGAFISMAAFGAMGAFAALTANPVSSVMMLFFLLLWGCLIVTVMIMLVTSQGFSLLFPFAALATATDENFSVVQALGQAFRLLFGNLSRVVIFGLLLFLVELVFSVTLNGPVMLWFGFEQGRLGLSEQQTIPLHMLVVLNLWSSVSNLVLVPYALSAAALFWYDCRVRKEGLDLQLRLERLGGKPKPVLNV